MRNRWLPRCCSFFSASLIAVGAHAMTINPNGTGQVLIYPYYTVNAHQQTIFTVGNPTQAGKAVQVTFREGYDGNVVYAIDVFLGPNATWSANVFAPEDAGQTGSGAAIVSTDTSCTYAAVHTAPATTPSGFSFDDFSNANYSGVEADSGPTTDARQREGFIEAIEMAEIQGDTLQSISVADGTPNCSQLPPATSNSADFSAPKGGLVGGAAVIDVPQGTFFAFEPRAIDGFRDEAVVPPNAISLSDAGDSASDSVSASINYHGDYLTLTFPRARAIDAVSALFMADTVYGDVDQTPSIGAGTAWVLTFPTKEYYLNRSLASPPFESAFSNGGSPVRTSYQINVRDGTFQSTNTCGFNECPQLVPLVQYQTQVITFLPQTSPPSAVLGSALVTAAPAAGDVGAALFTFSQEMDASNEGYVLIGIPVFGMQAINYVNSNVTAGVLSNYSGTAALRTTVSCSKNDAACE